MNARRLILAAMVSLSSLATGALLAAPGALGEELCPNAAARQGPSAALPDCRAYEQVTPVDKGDALDVFPSKGLEENTPVDRGYAADNGERFLLNTDSSFAGGDAYNSTYVFSRSAQGWTTTAVSPGAGVHLVTGQIFNPNLSAVGIEDEQFNHLPGQSEERSEASVAGPLGGPYATIDSVKAGVPGANDLVGASENLSHVVVESKDHELAPGAGGQVEGSTAVYEWFGGQLRLVNVATDGALLSPCGASLGLGLDSENGNTIPGGTHNAVSSDGSKIFFTAPDPYASGAGCWNEHSTPQENPPQVYMRVDGTSTVEVSAPDPGVGHPAGSPAIYVGASADGSKVFFMSSAELFEYDTEAPEGERLTRISSGESGNAEGNVDFVGAISNDGSTVYFAAFGKLAEGASTLSQAANEKAQGLVENGGGVNLYRYDTMTRKATYIAKINGNDYPLMPGEYDPIWYGHAGGAAQATEIALIADANWYTTANGRYLLFGSTVPLTGYDNTHAPAIKECQSLYTQLNSLPRCVELFRYSAAGNSIVCVSCAGGAPVADARFNLDALEVPDAGPLRSMSEDGSYVFFETGNALVPQTTDSAQHVYEWHDGKISLISSAGDTSNAYLLGASANGDDVFFGTHAQLVAQDTDVGGDLYDARIDGGFVGVTSPQCTGTGCQGVAAAPPIFATPASVTFEGVGNFPPGAGTQPKPVVKAKALTSKQRLVRALRACARDRPKRRRVRCEASAKARYARAHGSSAGASYKSMHKSGRGS